MLIARQIASQLRRSSPQHSFPPVAFDYGMFFLEDTEKQSYLGACLIGGTAVGINEMKLNQMKAVVSANFPAGTFVQFTQISLPGIDPYVDAWREPKDKACGMSRVIRDDQRELLQEVVEILATSYRSGKTTPRIRSTGMRLHRVIQIVSIKIPASSQPTDEEIQICSDLLEKFEQGIETFGLPVSRVKTRPDEYLWLLRTCFNPYLDEDAWYDPRRELREQVLQPGFDVDYTKSNEMVLGGEIYVRVFSPFQLPPDMHVAKMDLFQGDPDGINNQIPIPWMITLSIHLPDQAKKRSWFENTFRVLTFQASQGNVVKWVPRLAEKKKSADILKAELDQGGVPCEMSISMALYSKDRSELNRVSSQLTTYLSGYGLRMVEDTQILWPLFWNMLPLFPSPTSIERMDRYWSMSVNEALQFMPISSEWCGTRCGAPLLFETRLGQAFAFDLYDSDSNYNALLFAESGAGKSVVLNFLALSYLAEGGRVWITDIGRSYYKLVKACGGEFISFSENSQICLNPFTNVVDIDEEMDLLVALLAKMASPNDEMEPYARARLQEAIKAVWSTKGPAMTVNDVSQWLDMQSEPRMIDIAKMLYPFTVHGQFGHWFDGDNNLNFKSNLIVLELEELDQKPVLQQIVLMILMAKIQHDMFHSMGDGIKKIAIFDESWALFSDPGVAKFLNHAVRRFRKYKGSCVLAVQSIADFYAHPHMEAVAANAKHKFIMNQQPESIDRAVASDQLALDPYAVSQLKTVHTAPGAYSEIMFASGKAWSIARLVLPEFLKVLFSTSGEERDLIIQRIEQGGSARDVVNQYLIERNRDGR